MKLSTTSVVPADRERVFHALVDPAVLTRVIPGCESMTATGPDQYDVTLKIGVAGLKGTYSGKAAVLDQRPPDALTLRFEGKGTPGFVRGTAVIALTSEGAGTRVSSDADVHVGGLIAAVGSRLIEAAARKMADDFFHQLGAVLNST